MSPNMDQFGGQDDDFLTTGMQEVSRLFEEPVIIRRFTGVTAGNDALMQVPLPQYTSIPTMANITAMDQKELDFPNTDYAIGDLHAEFQIPIFGSESLGGDGGPRKFDDQVIYRGRTYNLVGHVQRPQLGGVPYYQAVLRQV